MSRGPAYVQRRIASAIAADPFRRWTVEDAARVAYPDLDLTSARLDRASRALNSLAPTLDLVSANEGLKGVLGWRRTYMLRSALEQLRSDPRKKS